MTVFLRILLLALAGACALAAGCSSAPETDEQETWEPTYEVATKVVEPGAEVPELGPLPEVPIAVAALPPPDPPQEPLEDPAELRSRFGSNILIRPDGSVTKQFYLSGEASAILHSLVKAPGAESPDLTKPTIIGAGAATSSILGRMLGERQVKLLFLPDFERSRGVAIRNKVNSTALPDGNVPKSYTIGLLLVTATSDGLSAFQGALNMFFANVPQVEIDVQVVEFSTSNSLATGVEQTDPSVPTISRLSTDTLVQNLISDFPLSTPLTGFGGGDDQGLITLGGIHNSWQLAAQLQFLEARGTADILSNPKVVVRNGGVASVETTTELPYPQAKITSSGQNVTANIEFKPVGIVLHIRPVIAGTEAVILQVFASVSAVTDFATKTSPVPTPIISSREVLTSVHLREGETTVIGGLVSRSTLTTEKKFPILGDIPILGYLFRSSTDITTKRTLQFHITPRIIQGARGFQADPTSG